MKYLIVKKYTLPYKVAQKAALMAADYIGTLNKRKMGKHLRGSVKLVDFYFQREKNGLCDIQINFNAGLPRCERIKYFGKIKLYRHNDFRKLFRLIKRNQSCD